MITWQSKNGRGGKAQADSHVIIICLMMCGGGNKERDRERGRKTVLGGHGASGDVGMGVPGVPGGFRPAGAGRRDAQRLLLAEPVVETACSCENQPVSR